jgi:hypothetical protein
MFSTTTIGNIPNILPAVTDTVLFETEFNPGSGPIGYQSTSLQMFNYISGKFVYGTGIDYDVPTRTLTVDATLTDIYNNSSGLMNITSYPFRLISTTNGFSLPSMTSLDVSNILLPLNGLMVWDSDIDRVVVNSGTPGFPTLEQLAYLSDISPLAFSLAYGEIYLNGNTIPTVNPGIGTGALINGFYINGLQLNFTGSGGLLTYTGIGAKTVSVSVSLSAYLSTSSASITAFMVVNNVPFSKASQDQFFGPISPENDGIFLTCLLTLNPGDQVGVYIQNNDNVDNIIVSQMNFNISTIGASTSTPSNESLNDAYQNGSDANIYGSPIKPILFWQNTPGVIPEIGLVQDSPITLLDPTAGVFSCYSTVSPGNYVVTGKIKFDVSNSTPSSDSANVILSARSVGTNVDFLKYEGIPRKILIEAKDSDFSGRVSVGPSVSGVNYTLGTSLDAPVSYPSNVFTLMWNTLSGTNIIKAGSFDIGDTIEVDIVGYVYVNIGLPNTDSGSNIRIKFGSLFTIDSNNIPLLNPTISTRPWNFKIKITRNSSTTLKASAYGSYFDLSNNTHPIEMYFPFTFFSYNELIDYALTMEYKNGNSPGNDLAFSATNLNIKQYS